ncbi:MAG: TrbG/VirB9 family P-type conjugative transfer protein [Pseudomonadota bacterium]|nr:TrbG/VirB9 family P-type conjugative transfer protein [Pseudomonadota bacterium]
MAHECHKLARGLPAVGIAVGLALGVVRSHAESVPAPGVVDGRIRSAAYDSQQVYRLRGRVGYQIDLQFEEGESFVGLGAGDVEGLAYSGQGNHLFLKPKAINVTTNITVITDRRYYQFEYSARPDKTIGADSNSLFALRFIYPRSAVKAAEEAAAQHVETDLREAPSRRSQNLAYFYCGGRALRPVFAADDGVHTRLRFADNADLPAVFVRGEDGSESLLNFNMDHGDMVIHRIARQFVLRRGRLTACVVNKGFAGSGLRLESGTVAPQVERRVHGGVP